MQFVKNIIKKSLYYSGYLSYLHNKRNKDTLTVLLFHRVLPVSDERWPQADMDWTVSDEFFKDCLRFFKKHYNVVSQKDVEAFHEQGIALPEKALLITFDDGWSDNLQYALPILKEFNIRPLLFVTTGAIGTQILSWQETLYSAWRIHMLTDDVVQQLADLLDIEANMPESENAIRQLVNQLQNESDEIKLKAAEISAQLLSDIPDHQMLTQDELNQLYKGGFDMGTHGVRHEPYTQSKNPKQEMEDSRQQLSELLSNEKPVTMSFPHGRVTEELIKDASQAGYKMIYTGRTVLNKPVRKDYSVLGRFNIEQCDLENANGRLSPEMMALYLFRQEAKAL